jgi:hypothetical protein
VFRVINPCTEPGAAVKQETEMTEVLGSVCDAVENNFSQSFRIASEAHTVSYGGKVKGA